MTIQDTTRKAGPFAGNGAATAFPFTFKVFTKADIALTMTDVNGAVHALVLDSDYSVTLNTDQETAPGGTITYPITGSPLPTGASMIGIGDLPYTQPTDITNSGGFYPSVIEDMSDRSTIQIQQLAELSTRSLHFPVVEANIDGEFPPVVVRAGTVFGFDANGNPAYLPIPASVGAGDLHDDVFVAGTDFAPGALRFPLSRMPLTDANVFAWWDDVPKFNFDLDQAAGDLVFTDGPPSDITKVRIRTGTTLSLNIPAFGSVTGDSINLTGISTFNPTIKFGNNPSGVASWAPAANSLNVEGFSVDLNGYGNRHFGGFANIAAISGSVNVPANAVLNANGIGIAGYVKNESPGTVTSSAVAVFGQADVFATGSLVWGMNSVSQDNGFQTTVWGNESDINLSNVNSAAFGYNAVGGSTVEPQQGTYAFWAGPLGVFATPQIRWAKGLFLDDSSAIVGIEVGCARQAFQPAATGSMPIHMYYAPASTGRTLGAEMTLDGAGNLSICQTNPGSLMALTVGGTAGIGQAAMSLQSAGGAIRWSMFGGTPAPRQTISGSKSTNLQAVVTSILSWISSHSLAIDATT